MHPYRLTPLPPSALEAGRDSCRNQGWRGEPGPGTAPTTPALGLRVAPLSCSSQTGGGGGGINSATGGRRAVWRRGQGWAGPVVVPILGSPSSPFPGRNPLPDRRGQMGSCPDRGRQAHPTSPACRSRYRTPESPLLILRRHTVARGGRPPIANHMRFHPSLHQTAPG